MAADHRRIDHLALAARPPRVQRGRDRERREHAGHHVGLGHAHHHRVAARLAGEAHDPAHPLHDEVVSGPGATGAILAEAADVTHDDARRDRADAVVGEAEVRERPRAEVLDQHIAALDHSLEHALPLGVLEVEGDAPLVAIDREVIRRHALDLRRHPRPGLVTGPRELDLDDVGAVVGEHQRAIRTGERAREIEDVDARQRALGRGHRRPSAKRTTPEVIVPMTRASSSSDSDARARSRSTTVASARMPGASVPHSSSSCCEYAAPRE